MTVLGLDYSAGRPSGTAVYAAGYRFVVRYLANGLTGRYNLTGAEVADMRAHGVDVALVWERKILGQPDRATQGRAAGIADAQAAQVQANAVGLGTLPIYFAVDFDLPDYSPAATSPRAKLGPVGDYLDGVASVLPHSRIGVYGGYYAVSRALDAGLAAWAWQTAAWSGGQVDPRSHLLQRIGAVTVGGVQCDVNEARQDQFGQAAPATTTPTSSEDTDMTTWVRYVDNKAVEHTGLFNSNSDFVGWPMPAGVRGAGNYSDFGQGPDADARWADAVGRFAADAALTTPQVSVTVNTPSGPVPGTLSKISGTLTFTPDAPTS